MHSMLDLGQSRQNVSSTMPGDTRCKSEQKNLKYDKGLLFLARFTRLFAYGALSVVLVFYLTGIGLTESRVGMLLTLTLLGDTIISLILTTQADRIGRRRMLIVGSSLMAGAGLAFALTSNFLFLVVAGTIGVISPSGNEVGPFLSIEQAALAHVVSASNRTTAFAWYTLTGSFATAIGSLCGGIVPSLVDSSGTVPIRGYRSVVIAYAVLGIVLALVFAQLSSATEVGQSEDRPSGLAVKKTLLGIGHSRVSALLASRLASRIGLVRTMVFTHLPSNILLILLPLMPSLRLAIGVLLLRFSISQMDVPTRQSYTMAVVRPEERAAAAGITGVARTIGASIPPMFVGIMFARPNWINAPFFIAGTLKIAYDLLLYRQFVAIQPPEEKF